MPVIQPTIGRRVLVFSPSNSTGINDPSVPFDAGIAYVWGDECINVGYRDHAGIAGSMTSVKLYDRAQDDSDKHGKEGEGWYAVWMPYQFEQALRAQAPRPANTGRAGDIQLTKLEENGVLTDAGREKLAMAPQEVTPAGILVEEESLEPAEADGGVLEGTNRTTSGAIGQP